MAKAMAKSLGYTYVDSGAMYRAVTLFAIQNGFIQNGVVNKESLIKSLPSIFIDFILIEGKNSTRLNDEVVENEIRGLEVSSLVSQVSRIAEVRKKLREIQQDLAKRKGVVMDGRDIGSAVLPDAELKIFMTADKEIRAKRRYDELTAKGEPTSLEEIKENIRLRDEIDTTRKENPLIQTEDARLLDNSNLTQEEQLKIALGWANTAIQQKNP